MQIRVVIDQPWQAAADVLAIPLIGEPAFTGALGELDRRTGGELSALQAFGELRTTSFGPSSTPAHSALPASCPHAGWFWSVAATGHRSTARPRAAWPRPRSAGW